MSISKRRILQIVKRLPGKINVDDLIYQLYLQKKMEHAEEDIRLGRIFPHERVLRQWAKWSK